MTARRSAYDVAHVDDLDAIPIAHGLVWRPVRRRFDVRAFGVNAYTSEQVGGQVVEEHTESQLGHEEIYLVLRGSATFTLDDEEVELEAGTLVHIAANIASHAERPDHPPLLYNLACVEARAGRSVDALAHLRRAVELEPKWAAYARTDTDFASIRREPGFPA